MKRIFIISFLLMNTSLVLFDFSQESNLRNWRIVDDVVMGGRSDGNFYINKEGHGVFTGKVSLENNGGFSSVRYRFRTKKIDAYSKIKMRLKGDGKKYQFRFKTSLYDYHSYVIEFTTSGEWEIVTLNLDEMRPQFRGRKLRMNNFPGKQIEEMAILIGNKKPEKFQLLIDKIELE